MASISKKEWVEREKDKIIDFITENYPEECLPKNCQHMKQSFDEVIFSQKCFWSKEVLDVPIPKECEKCKFFKSMQKNCAYLK